MNIDNIAKKLCELSLTAGYSEKIVKKMEDNDHYKVCYRFIANMLSEWKELGFDHFPAKNEAIEIARKAHPYFNWAFEKEDGLGTFERLYDFHRDIWEF